MKLKLIAAAALAASAALADAKWTYDADAKTLTGVLADGETTANVFNLSDAGVLSQNTVGDQTEIDLRAAAMPDDSPAVVEVKTLNKYTSTTALYLPETVEKIADGLFNGVSALTEVTFPESPKFTKIPVNAFRSTGILDVTIPEGVTVIGNSAFQQCTKLVHVRLPETLEVLEDNAFNGATALLLVEPCIPGGVTNLAQAVFRGCSAMTNDVRVGFGTDPTTGEPRWVTFGVGVHNRNFAFRDCHAVQSMAFGSGVKEVPTMFYEGGDHMKGLERVEFGPNVTTFSDNFSKLSKLTNMVFRAADGSPDFVFRDFELGWGTGGYNATFHPLPSCLRDITWERWFTYTLGTANPFSNCKSRDLRFFVPGSNLKWAAFIADASRMTPWADVSSADQAYYYSRYGDDAPTPVGLSVAVADGLNRTWIVTDGESPAGALLELGECWTQFASVTLSPEPTNEDGSYADGTSVTATFTPQDGVVFTGWAGSATNGLDAAAIAGASITFVASGAKTLKPTFTSDFIVYDEEAGEMTDGSWVLKAEGAADAITVRGFKRSLASSGAMPVDLTRPVRSGDAAGRIVAVNGYMASSSISELMLPDTLEVVGGMSRDNQSCDVARLTPFLPNGVTNVLASAFHKQTNMTGDLRIGFATDADGNVLETVLNNSCLDCMQKMGPSLCIGPGVKRIARNTFSEKGNAFGSNYSGAFEITVGKNVAKGVGGSMRNVGKAEGNKGVAQNPITVRYEGEMFDGSSGMFLGASAYNSSTDGPTAWNGTAPAPYGMRFYVGADGCKEWKAFIADTAKVTPWAQLDDDVKEEYWKLFPRGEQFGTKRPYGLTTEAAVMTNDFPKAYGLPARQWVFSLAQPGFVISIR